MVPVSQINALTESSKRLQLPPTWVNQNRVASETPEIFAVQAFRAKCIGSCRDRVLLSNEPSPQTIQFENFSRHMSSGVVERAYDKRGLLLER